MIVVLSCVHQLIIGYRSLKNKRPSRSSSFLLRGSPFFLDFRSRLLPLVGVGRQPLISSVFFFSLSFVCVLPSVTFGCQFLRSQSRRSSPFFRCFLLVFFLWLPCFVASPSPSPCSPRFSFYFHFCSLFPSTTTKLA